MTGKARSARRSTRYRTRGDRLARASRGRKNRTSGKIRSTTGRRELASARTYRGRASLPPCSPAVRPRRAREWHPKTYALGPSRPSETPPRATRNNAEGAVVLLFFEKKTKFADSRFSLFLVVGVFLPTSAMGAAESRPPPPSWLVEACATLDPRDVDEVVSVFRRASKNAEAPGEPGASCPSNPADAAAWVVEQERHLGWRTLEHDASAREALREAFGTPPPLDAVLDRLARSVVAGDATTSTGHRSSSADDDGREKNQSGGALCAALASRALCRRAASGDGDAVSRLTRAVSPRESGENLATAADRTRDERARIELARALASVAAPPRGTPCLLYTSPSPRDATLSRMPSSA